MTAEREHELVRDGDYIVDVTTGEIVDIVPERSGFRVDSQDAAEWVLERLQEAEAEVWAIERRKHVILENLTRLSQRAEGRAKWLRQRFGPELEAWARGQLEGRRERTVTTPFGRLSFRRTPGRIGIRDLLQAANWCEAHAPAAVRMEPKVLVSELKGREAELPEDAFEVVGPSDAFRVEVSS